ncbi:MAG: NAD(P)H-hydrate dehydratase [Pseudomonadota bacterium]
MGLLFSVAEIRAIEQRAAAVLAAGTLMRRAGSAAAQFAQTVLDRRASPAAVLVLAGPGNNGGDALELAANLAAQGHALTVLHLAGAAPSPETAQALQRARDSRAHFVGEMPAGGAWALVVDGLYGIGLRSALDARAEALVKAVNALVCPVLALDVPSGLDADSGSVAGTAVRATHTITFIGDKPGLHTGAGRDYAGAVSVATLGLEAGGAGAFLNEAAAFAGALRARANDSHKGSYGDVSVVGGAQGMAGAAVLAARAALYTGAGRVFVASVDRAAPYDALQPELMLRHAAEHRFDGGALVVGCGLGNSDQALGLVRRAIDSACPLVLDADALNLIAAHHELLAPLAGRRAPTILTPHPLEAARLLGNDRDAIQGDRLGAARTLAARFGACVVLKGSGTVVARPDARLAVNPTGNPGLATAGTGDVLAGICASLLAQGWPGWEAALGAVWIHGSAADALVERGVGPIGLTASELPAAARTVLNQLVHQFRPGVRPLS